MAKKKKQQGRYCRVCGERKSNESFTSNGHARHICKACESLSLEERNELRFMTYIEEIAEKHPRTRKDWELLEKYAKDKRYPQVQDFAIMILEMSGRTVTNKCKTGNNTENIYPATHTYSKLGDDTQDDAGDWIANAIYNFVLSHGILPKDQQKEKILEKFCKEFSVPDEYKLLPDENMEELYAEILEDIDQYINEIDNQ